MKLSLGTVQFGLPYGIANQSGQVSFEEAIKMIQFAEEIGIQFLDTAAGYGESETVLGKIGVSRFRVVSKLPALPSGVSNVRNWIINSIEKSLEKLKISQLYGLLLHRSELLWGDFADELYGTIQELKKQNYINKFGISIYSPSELEKTSEQYRLDLVQAPLNVIDRSLLSSGWMKKLKSKNTEVHVRSVFLQGLLLMNNKQRPEKFSKWNSTWDEWNSWLVLNHIHPLEASLGYVRSIQEIDRIIVGADSYSHLFEIWKAFNSDFPYSIPETLESKDVNLINPSLWSKL